MNTSSHQAEHVVGDGRGLRPSHDTVLMRRQQLGARMQLPEAADTAERRATYGRAAHPARHSPDAAAAANGSALLRVTPAPTAESHFFCSPTEVGEQSSAARLRGSRREASIGAPSDPALRAGLPPPLPRGRNRRPTPAESHFFCSPTEVGELSSAARLRGPRREASIGAPSDPALRAGPPPPLPRGRKMGRTP